MVSLGAPVQIAYGVDDVEAAARHWAEHQGAGPFFVRHHIPVTDVVLAADGPAQDPRASFDHSSAYGWWGVLMVELVTVHDPPALAATGLHHLAHFVDSLAEASASLAARGWPRILRASAGSTTFVYHDARAELGHLVELYEPSDPLRAFYARVADAATGWDGADPVRVIG